MKSTKTVTKIATDPLSGVAKKTIKMMPFVGTDDDIWTLVHDRYALWLFQTEVLKAYKKSIPVLKKAKFPATKMKLITAAFKTIEQSLDHEIHLQAWASGVLSMLSSFVKACKTSIPTAWKDGKRIAEKKVTLTSAQAKILQEEAKNIKEKIEAARTSLKNLAEYITVQPTSAYQSKHAMKNRRDQNHAYVDDLISTKFDIVTHQKKLYYLLLELERKVKKAASHKNSLSTSQLQSLVDVKIPAQITIIKNFRTSVAEIENKQNTNTKDFLKWIDTWLSDVEARLDINKQETAKTKKQNTLLIKKDEKSLATKRKAYKKSSTALLTHLKEPYATPDALQKRIQKENDVYLDLEEGVLDRLSLDYSSYMSESRDIMLLSYLVQEHINRGYDTILLEKEMSLQIWLLNRIHKKQLAAQTKIDKQLKKLKTMSGVPSLKTVLTRNTSASKVIKKRISDVEKQRTSYTTSIDARKKTIKDQRNLVNVIPHKQHKISAVYEHDIKRSMIWYLTKDLSQLESNIWWQEKLVEQVANTLKKSEIQLQENERSVFALQDKKRTSKAKDFEKVVHAQEVTLDTLEHHLDYEKDIAQATKDHVKQYTKDTKKLLNRSKKETSTLKKKKKNFNKDTLSKRVAA